MGVAGAAIATVLAQALVTLLYVLYARRDAHLLQRVRIFARPDLKKIRDILRIGLPSAVQGALFTSISMVLARTVAVFGDTAIAVQKVGSQIESISWMTADGFSAALSSFIAQNHGAGNFERTKRGFRSAFTIMVCWGIFTSLLLSLRPRPFSASLSVSPKLFPWVSTIWSFWAFHSCSAVLKSWSAALFPGLAKRCPHPSPALC